MCRVVTEKIENDILDQNSQIRVLTLWKIYILEEISTFVKISILELIFEINSSDFEFKIDRLTIIFSCFWNEKRVLKLCITCIYIIWNYLDESFSKPEDFRAFQDFRVGFWDDFRAEILSCWWSWRIFGLKIHLRKWDSYG